MSLLAATLLFATMLPPAQMTICIDPGHPSEVGNGTRGEKLTEIHVNWEVAQRLEKELHARHFNVVLTKKTEMELVKNRDRARIANECHADLMVRLHCDSSSGSGFTTYYPDRQGSADGFTGPSRELIKTIKPIANRFHDSLAKSLKGFLRDNGIFSDIKTAVGSIHGAL